MPTAVPSKQAVAYKDFADAEVARRIASGDDEAFRYLMRQHNQKLFRTARSILKDDAEAEDAVQEAYLLAYRAMSTFRNEAKLSTWLVRIVVNESIGRARKQKRSAEVIRLDGEGAERGDEFPEQQGDNREDPVERPEMLAQRRELRTLLEKKIDALPDAFRSVFMMRAVEEMSAEETSAALGIPDATVRTRFFRAKSLLRESLAREIDFALEDAFAFDGARCDRIVEGVILRVAVMRKDPSGT